MSHTTFSKAAGQPASTTAASAAHAANAANAANAAQAAPPRAQPGCLPHQLPLQLPLSSSLSSSLSLPLLFALSVATLAATLSTPAQAATSRTKPARQAAPPPSALDDLRAWSMDVPRPCPDAGQGAAAPSGWRVQEVRCTWRNLLQMRSWQADPAPATAAASCVSAQGSWWAWSRARLNPARTHGGAVWDSAWRANSMSASSATGQRIAVLRRAADGSWRATEWTWTPSERAATRAWQQSRWQHLLNAALSLRSSSGTTAGGAAPGPEAAQLLSAWERNLGARPADAAAGAWRWESHGVCLSVDTVGLSTSQPHMPYAEDEGRLEQRAAMQLQLARRFPQVQWLTPFRLLPRAAGAQAAGGAKYEAIWLDGATMYGQLWIPRKKDGAVLRLRIAAGLPPVAASAKAALVARSSFSLERELGGIALAWSELHER